MSNFNKKEIYNNEILPIIKELKQKCFDNNLQFFIAVATENNENETKYEYEFYKENPMTLKNDNFIEFLNVTNGFKTLPFKESELNFDDSIFL